MVASPVVTGDTVVGFGYGFDPMPPFAEVLARIDKDGDGRLSIAESGKDGWLKGIANYVGNRDGFIVESEWLAANAAVVAPSSLVAVSLGSRRGGGDQRARAVAIREELFRGRPVAAGPRRAGLHHQERRGPHHPSRRHAARS